MPLELDDIPKKPLTEVTRFLDPNSIALFSETKKSFKPYLTDEVQKAGLIKAVKKGGYHTLEHAPKALRGDKEVVLAAVMANGTALKYASDELRADEEVILYAIAQNPQAINYLLSQEGDTVEALIIKTGSLIHIINKGKTLGACQEELRNDKTFVTVAVTQHWKNLEFASKELRADKGVVMAALNKNSQALKYATEALQGDKEVVLAALKGDGFSLRFASEELKDDVDVVIAAVKKKSAMRKNMSVLSFASDRIKTHLKENGIDTEDDSAHLEYAVVLQALETIIPEIKLTELDKFLDEYQTDRTTTHLLSWSMFGKPGSNTVKYLQDLVKRKKQCSDHSNYVSIDELRSAIVKSDYSADKNTGTKILIDKLNQCFIEKGIDDPGLLSDQSPDHHNAGEASTTK